MSQSSNISKMFGALVLGGGVLLSNNGKATPPETQETKTPTTQPAPQKEETKKEKPTEVNEFCQLEFTHIQYNEEGRAKTLTKTCLDEKKDEEILKIIKDAQKNTCMSPFCGCWLG
tara:strand:+ start:727 stop:1074 length:348 start_codon:yes stop_codon:yes gene_type:complete